MNVTVRRVVPRDWATLRDVRLAALTESPSAFGSSYTAEADRGDEFWIERARRSSAGPDAATFLAWFDGAVVGLVGAFRVESGGIDLVSMWTAPDGRRCGVGRRLVAAVIAWATEAAAGRSTSIELWVTRGNEPALRLYEALGFEVTGDHQPLPSDPCKDEIRMRLEPGVRRATHG